MAAAYKESIAYVNAVGGSKFTLKELDQADGQLQQIDLRKIDLSEMLFVEAPSPETFPEELRGGDASWNSPLWLCRSCEKNYDEDAESEIKIQWWACGNSAEGNMAGKWFPMCVGGHRLVSHCRGNQHGPWMDQIEVCGRGISNPHADACRLSWARAFECCRGSAT